MFMRFYGHSKATVEQWVRDNVLPRYPKAKDFAIEPLKMSCNPFAPKGENWQVDFPVSRTEAREMLADEDMKAAYVKMAQAVHPGATFEERMPGQVAFPA